MKKFFAGQLSECRFSFWIPVFFLMFSLGAVGTEIVKIDMRFALMIQDLSRHPLGIFPTINGVPYADYLSPWVAAAWLTSLGGRFVNLWTMLAPTLLLSAYIVAMTWKIGDRLRPGAGILAAALSFFSVEYLFIFMSFGIDVPVAAAGVTMLYVLLRNPAAGIQLTVFAAALVFSFVIRGPLGLLLVGAATAGWLFARMEWKKIIWFGLVGALTAGLCAAGGYTLIHHTGGTDLWNVFLEWQISKRMRYDDWFFYFICGIPSFGPAALLTLLTLILNWKKLGKAPFPGMLGYLLLPMILLSIPGCKHLRYMTLCLPAFCALAAYGLTDPALRVPGMLEKILKVLDRRLSQLFLIAAFVLAVVGVLMFNPEIPLFCRWILGGVLLAVFFHKTTEEYSLKRFLLRVCFGFGILYLTVIFPFQSLTEDSHTFVGKLEKDRKGKVFLYDMGPDHDDLKYVLHTRPERRGDIVYLYENPPGPKDHYSKMYPGLKFSDSHLLIRPIDVVIVRRKYLSAFESKVKSLNRQTAIVRTGTLGHKDYCAVAVLPK